MAEQMLSVLRGLALAAIAIWVPHSPASAQSFNCFEAYTPDEITICERPGLLSLDRELHSLYRKKLNQAPEFLRYMIREGQESWRRSRFRCRKDVRCIRVHYRARLRELQAVLDSDRDRFDR